MSGRNGRLWISRPNEARPEGENDPGVLSVEIEEAEGQVATITLVRKQQGLQRFIEGADTNITVWWGPSDHGGDSRVIARGRVESPPSGMLTTTQTLTAVCGPLNLTERLLEYAQDKLTATVDIDRLFSDFDETDPQSYLLSRSGMFYVDPANHDVGSGIDVIDELRGKSVIDLTDAAILDKGRVREVSQNEFGPAVRRLKARCTIEWTQSAAGTWSTSGGMATLDPGVAGNPMQAITLIPSDGWTLGDASIFRVKDAGETPLFDCGTIYEVETRDGEETVVRQARGEVSLQKWDIDILRLQLAWNLDQDRREVVEAELEVPMVGALGRSEDETIDMTLVDVFETLRGTDDWVPGVEYAKGAYVIYGGKRYRAVKDHLSTSFDQWGGETELVEVAGVPFLRKLPVWQEVASDPDDLTASSPSFFTTSKGKAVAAAMMRRLAKEGRRRLRALRVAVRLTWLDAQAITLKHSVRLKAWDGDQFYTLTGKVVRIRRTWPFNGGMPEVEIEVGIAFGGDGRLSTAPVPASEGAYFQPGYVVPGYDAAVSSLSRYHGDLASNVDRFFSVSLYDPVEGMREGQWLRTMYSTGSDIVQLRAARLIGLKGGDVRKCTSKAPTRLVIGMKPIETTGTLEQVFKPKGRLLDAPCGIGE